MSAMRTFTPPIRAVSPSTTQFLPPPVLHTENILALTIWASSGQVIIKTAINIATALAITPAYRGRRPSSRGSCTGPPTAIAVRQLHPHAEPGARRMRTRQRLRALDHHVLAKRLPRRRPHVDLAVEPGGARRCSAVLGGPKLSATIVTYGRSSFAIVSCPPARARKCLPPRRARSRASSASAAESSGRSNAAPHRCPAQPRG